MIRERPFSIALIWICAGENALPFWDQTVRARQRSSRQSWARSSHWQGTPGWERA